MPEVRAHRSGTFCWADLPTTDLDHAIAFYSELFDWRAVDAETPEGYGRYVLFQKNGKTVAAAYAMEEEELSESGVAARWESFIATKAVDELTARAAELGATVVAPPYDMPGVARMAVLTDPEGATFTLYQADPEIGTQLLNEPGAPCWFELYARDLGTSTRFYADLFGYELRDAVGLGGAPYVQLGIGKGAAAGAMQLRPEWGDMPPMWAVYFQTDDLDAAISRAESHGGDLLMAPTQVPGVGRFAMLCDPQGASFMLMEMGAPARKSPPPAPAAPPAELEVVEELEAVEAADVEELEAVEAADVDEADEVEPDAIDAADDENAEAEADAGDDDAEADASDDAAEADASDDAAEADSSADDDDDDDDIAGEVEAGLVDAGTDADVQADPDSDDEPLHS